MATCRHCEKAFPEVKPWQVFCCERCQQDWHLHQRKIARQERLFDRLKEREEGNGHALPVEEQRQKASEVLARIIAQADNGRKFVRRI